MSPRCWAHVYPVSSSSPFLYVGGYSSNVSNGNAGPGYVNNWTGNSNTNNGARLKITYQE